VSALARRPPVLLSPSSFPSSLTTTKSFVRRSYQAGKKTAWNELPPALEKDRVAIKTAEVAQAEEAETERYEFAQAAHARTGDQEKANHNPRPQTGSGE